MSRNGFRECEMSYAAELDYRDTYRAEIEADRLMRKGRRPDLWLQVKNVFRFPILRLAKKAEKVKAPFKYDTKPGPVRIYTREEIAAYELRLKENKEK